MVWKQKHQEFHRFSLISFKVESPRHHTPSTGGPLVLLGPCYLHRQTALMEAYSSRPSLSLSRVPTSEWGHSTQPQGHPQCKSLPTVQLVRVPKIPSRAVTSAPLSPTLTPRSPLWLLRTTPNAMTFQVVPSWHMLFHLYDNILFAPTFSLAKRVPTLLSWPGLSSGKPVSSEAAEVMALCPHSDIFIPLSCHVFFFH